VLTAGEIAGFRAGDADAVRAVYREYGRLVYAVALRTLGDRQLAEEATQQTFVKAWQAATAYDADRDMGPWLGTIAKRTAIDIHRREARRAVLPLDSVPPAHPAAVEEPPSVERASDAWEVRQAVDDLPPDEREVVRLQHLEQLTHPEIAERLGIPMGTVKSRSFRAHKRLAARLGHLRNATGSPGTGTDPPPYPGPEVRS
jgi:RNA polymerase sigma-70 factor (ECF subfamily)